MTRCLEYYDKWEKEPNWCNLCASAVSQINSYIELVNEIENAGADRKFTMVNLPERVARPIYTIKDPKARAETVKNLVEYLKQSNSKKLDALQLHNLLGIGKCRQSEPSTITTKIHRNEKKIEQYQERIRTLEQENAELRKCIQMPSYRDPVPSESVIDSDMVILDGEYFRNKPKNDGMMKIIGVPTMKTGAPR
jgi:hypothetical protein